ncbi:MAG: TRAP transporter substrate-binding protein [Firmicutes bacterium]|nr:TRAP transporter substrate-binding protein [Bacillota bacterium]
MRKRLLSCLLLVVLLVASFSTLVQAKVVIRFAHFTPEDHPGHLATLRFAENVTKRTNGEITFEIYPNNELGAPPEVLEQTILGVIDMSTPTQGSLDKYSKKFAVVMAPFVFDSYEHAHAVLDGPFAQWVAADLEKHNLVLLSTWEYGFRQTTNSVRPINSVKDLAGLSMRTPPEIQFVAAFEAAGCKVQQIAFNELYLALQQGLVHGQENPLSTILANKLYETQPYLAITNHIYSSQVHVIRKDLWDRLTKEQQQIIKEESIAAGKYMRELVMSQEEDYLNKLIELGVKVTYPDIAEFREAMQPAYKVISNYAGAQNMKEFLEMVERCR